MGRGGFEVAAAVGLSGVISGMVFFGAPPAAWAKPPRFVVVDGTGVGEVLKRGRRPVWRGARPSRWKRWMKKRVVYRQVGVGKVKKRKLCYKGLRHLPMIDAKAFDLYGVPACRVRRKAAGKGVGQANGNGKTTGKARPRGSSKPMKSTYRGKVLVAGPVDVPRTVKSVPTDKALRAMKASLLALGTGVKTFRVVQSFAVDLDGDRRKELVTVVGGKKGRNRGRAGDFSAVLVRSKGTTYPVAWSFKKGDFRLGKKRGGTLFLTYRLAALADLDGDGVFELVVEQDYGEGGGAVVVRFRRGKVKYLLDVALGP